MNVSAKLHRVLISAVTYHHLGGVQDLWLALTAERSLGEWWPPPPEIEDRVIPLPKKSCISPDASRLRLPEASPTRSTRSSRSHSQNSQRRNLKVSVRPRPGRRPPLAVLFTSFYDKWDRLTPYSDPRTTGKKRDTGQKDQYHPRPGRRPRLARWRFWPTPLASFSHRGASGCLLYCVQLCALAPPAYLKKQVPPGSRLDYMSRFCHSRQVLARHVMSYRTMCFSDYLCLPYGRATCKRCRKSVKGWI